jgi:hypothetical protein
MLAVHLTTSVGWLGAILAYLVLDLAVSTNADPRSARWQWQAMDMVVSRAIVPLAGGAILTGLIMGLGTSWGLFRYWWVLISLLLTLFAAVVLLSEAEGIRGVAAIASDGRVPDAEFRTMRGTLPHSIGGFTVLFVVQVLNVLKPRGLTPYGWRRQHDERRRTSPNTQP